MIKSVKHIVAANLVIGALSVTIPINSFILGIKAVYASTHSNKSDEETNSSDNDDEDIEQACLKSIYLSHGGITFLKKETSYNINVNDDVEDIIVRAIPEDEDDLVEINDASVEESDDYEKKVKLNKGNNTVKIKVENDDNNTSYVLNIYRGTSSALSENTTSNFKNISIQINNVGKYNTWQINKGKLQFIDGTGEVLRNQWWFDKYTGKYYYLRDDGTRAVGWFKDKNNWYYFDENGEMKKGWVFIDGNWYYMDKSGTMRTGWIEDENGNWYYLDLTGKLSQTQ